MRARKYRSDTPRLDTESQRRACRRSRRGRAWYGGWEGWSAPRGRPLGEGLATEFFGYHLGLYRLRPVLWLLASPAQRAPAGRPAFGCFLYWHRLDADTLRKVREVYLRTPVESARIEAERR